MKYFMLQIMTRTIHYCTFCDYKSDRKHDRDRHVTRKHGMCKEGAPTSTTHPTIDYSSAAENRQHLTGYHGSGVLHTTLQHDPTAKPEMQYNEVRHQGQGPQTSVNYSVSQKCVTNEDTDNETDTETVSETDTEDDFDTEEYDVYGILNDITLANWYLKVPRSEN